MQELELLKKYWQELHPRSFTVSLRKQDPVLYNWVLSQPDIVETHTFSDKVFTLLNPNKPKCLNCNNEVSSLTRHGWSIYCSTKCKGVHNSNKSRNKSRETCIKKYGVTNPTQLEITRNKMKTTMTERYGVEYAKQSLLLREKAKSTMVERHGVEYPIQNKDIQEKIKNTCMQLYGVPNSAQKNIDKDSWNKLNNKDWLKEQYKVMSIDALSVDLNVSVATVCRFLKQHGIESISRNKSAAEIEITDYLKLLRPDLIIQTGVKNLIHPYEIDIYIPELNIAIEYNGSWYHSELNGKNRSYHLNKTRMCNIKGVQLIHIWEHEYKTKKDIILSKLSNFLGKSNTIYARKCTIKELDNQTANNFLNSTHIQGSSISKIRLGLYNCDELVAVMTFGKTRFNKNYEWELLRYSSKLNHNVAGGFSKLFSYFVKNYNPLTIITYSDKMWSQGNVYSKNQFKFLNTIAPSYFYTKDYINFENRINYQKRKLPELLTYFDETLSEWDNMKNNGFDRIWNCGNDSWVWTAVIEDN